MLWLALLSCGTLPDRVEVAEPPAPVPVLADAIHHTLAFPDAARHLVDVTTRLPTGGAEQLEVMMATWTPGSYLVRDYARNAEGMTCAPPCTVKKTAKNRWTLSTGGGDAVQLSYRLYAREMGVQSNWVDADLAMLNGAATFVVPVEQQDQPATVTVEAVEGWTVQTALDPVEGQADTWVARDYDELVDTPWLMGALAVYPFEVHGVPHALVDWGEAGVWDGAKAAADVQKIVEVQTAFWGDVPYPRYLFLNVLSGAYGGLEHLDSTLMISSRWNTHDDDAYGRWLGLVSHEFFHTWNVKRLRPVELGPFDYEREVLTENLWVAEGITSYYDDLLLVRAGLIDADAYLDRLSKNIADVQTTPGRQVHPLSETSRDAWIKFYKKDENSANTTISYYRKGAVVGWLLDVEIRRHTANRRSVDDVMRLAYQRHSGERGYTSAEFRAIASEVAAVDLDPWFAEAVDGTGELDYSHALEFFGLALDDGRPEGDSAADDGDGAAWSGVELSGNSVRRVLRDTPAWQAGLNVDDEVLAIDGFRVEPGQWSNFEGRYSPGDTAELLVARHGQLRTLSLSFARHDAPTWALSLHETGFTQPITHREQWLGLD